MPKPNGKYRPIINLRYLNFFIKYKRFKQETFKLILDLIQEEDFFTSIDLQEAYFSVAISIQFFQYLKFMWDSQLFHFVCLPFGLASVPKVFTRIVRPIYAWFRQQYIRCAYYIDDSLNMDRNFQVCLNNTHTMVDVLESLCFTINKKNYFKSCSENHIVWVYYKFSEILGLFCQRKRYRKLVILPIYC